MNLKHEQQEILMQAGDNQKTAIFPNFDGKIMGYSLVPIGIPAGKTADITIKDGSKTVLEPIDISMANVANRTSYKGSVAPLNILNPGRITAVITPSETVAVGDDYSVKVIIHYIEGKHFENVTLKDCL